MTRRRILKATGMLVVATCTTLAAITTHGGPIAYEGFDYPNDGPAVHGRAGGFGWGGAWINTMGDFQHLTQDDTSLNSPAFPFTPIGDRVAGTGGAARRVMGESFNLAQDGTIYLSFLFRKENTGDGSNRNVELGVVTAGGATQVIRFGSTSGHRFFLTSTAEANLGGTVTFGETYFVVLKGVAVASGTDQFFAKIYSTSDSPPVAEPLTWDLTFNIPAGQANLNLPEIRLAFGNAASGAIDEIRIGRTFADVALATAPIPEPSSLVLLTIATGWACAARRRRSSTAYSLFSNNPRMN